MWLHFLSSKKKNINKFDLIIDFQSKIRNRLILKTIPHKFFISSCFNFRLSNPKIEVKKINKINNNILQAINLVLGINLKLEDYDIDKIDNSMKKNVNVILQEGEGQMNVKIPLIDIIEIILCLNQIISLPL